MQQHRLGNVLLLSFTSEFPRDSPQTSVIVVRFCSSSQTPMSKLTEKSKAI